MISESIHGPNTDDLKVAMVTKLWRCHQIEIHLRSQISACEIKNSRHHSVMKQSLFPLYVYPQDVYIKHDVYLGMITVLKAYSLIS